MPSDGLKTAMAYEGGPANVEVTHAFLESLQNDFKAFSSETKKKHPQIKEVNVLVLLGSMSEGR